MAVAGGTLGTQFLRAGATSLWGTWCLWSFAFLGQVIQRSGWSCSDVSCSDDWCPSPCCPLLPLPAVCCGSSQVSDSLLIFFLWSTGYNKTKHVNANNAINTGASAEPDFCLTCHQFPCTCWESNTSRKLPAVTLCPIHEQLAGVTKIQVVLSGSSVLPLSLSIARFPYLSQSFPSFQCSGCCSVAVQCRSSSEELQGRTLLWWFLLEGRCPQWWWAVFGEPSPPWIYALPGR